MTSSSKQSNKKISSSTQRRTISEELMAQFNFKPLTLILQRG